jgi:hypothetical protein
MSEARHGKQTIINGIHGFVAYSYVDGYERSAASGFESKDLYKVAFQEDDESYWILQSVSPIEWVPLAGQFVITGDLDMDGYSIINVDLINGVDIEDHGERHNPDGADPLTIGTPTDVGDANANGSADSYVRSDHVHKLGGSVGGDLSGTLPNPTVTDLTISSEEQGSILYYNGANWVQLPPGDDGYVLETQGTGANPNWVSVSAAGGGEDNVGSNVGGGVGEVYRDKTGITLNFKTFNVEGDLGITNGSDVITLDGYDLLPLDGGRTMTGDLNMGGNDITVVGLVDGVDVSDHSARHQPDAVDALATASAVSVGATNSEGNDGYFARSDHTHAVTDLSIASQEQGSILYFNGSNWVELPPGDDGYVLQTQGTGANPQWVPFSVEVSEYFYNESEAESTTNSSIFQQKVRLSATVTGGTYQLEWCFTWRHASGNTDASFQVEQDDATQLWYALIEPKDTSSNQRIPAAGFKELDLAPGSYTFDLDFRSVIAFTTTGISQARIKLYRVGD